MGKKYKIGKKTMEQNSYVYTLELTEQQARKLSYACDYFSRIICGQDFILQELLEAAWEKRCKEATGKMMDEEWDGGWFAMRQDAEDICYQIKKRFWNLAKNQLHGIRYDDTADILYDLHRVIRHQLWKDNPNRSSMTVDAEKPFYAIGKEPLAVIKRKEVE